MQSLSPHHLFKPFRSRRVCSSLFIFCHKWPGRGCRTPPGNIENRSKRQGGWGWGKGGQGGVWRESLGEGGGQTRGGAAPLLSLLIPGVGTAPPAGGAPGRGGWRGRPRTSRVKPCPVAGPKCPLKWTRPEVPPLPGLTAMPTGWQRSSCPYLELCPALVQGEGALKAGSPRSSSLGVGERRLGAPVPPPSPGLRPLRPRGRAGGAQASGPFWARSLAGFPLRNSPTYKPYCGKTRQ